MCGCPSGKHWLPKSAQWTTNEGKPWPPRKLAESLVWSWLLTSEGRRAGLAWPWRG